MDSAIEKGMDAARLNGFELALDMVKINLKYGMQPLDGLEDERKKLEDKVGE